MAGPLSDIRILPDTNATEGGTSALQETFPSVYGFLGGFMGTAPDKFERGSVLDPVAAKRDAAIRAGAEMGYPISIATQIYPLVSKAVQMYGSAQKAKAAVDAALQASYKAPARMEMGGVQTGLGESGDRAVAAYKKALERGGAPKEADLYAGHNPDGGGVQLHSSGSQYPYVIGSRHGGDMRHYVLDPAGAEQPFATGLGATKFANAAAKVRSLEPYNVYGGKPRTVASMTAEDVPGAVTGHRPDILTGTPSDKGFYASSAPWVDSEGTDVLYKAAGYDQLPTKHSTGMYTNSQGVVENQPMLISRPEVPYRASTGRVTPQTLSELDTIENLRGLVDAQEAYGGNIPRILGSAKGANGVVMQSPTQPTGKQLASINTHLPKGYGASATDEGVALFPFDQSVPLDPGLYAAANKSGFSYPSRTKMASIDTVFGPGAAKFDSNYNIVAAEPGEATSALLDKLRQQRPGLSSALGSDPDVLSAIKGKISRDTWDPGAQVSSRIQETRKMLASGDMPKVVEMIRKGMTPAAALAALGYNINAMAEEK